MQNTKGTLFDMKKACILLIAKFVETPKVQQNWVDVKK